MNVVPPQAGTRWRNRHTGEVVTVRLNLPNGSPGGAISTPLVEIEPPSEQRTVLETLAGHSPWVKLADWHEHWEPAQAMDPR